MSTFKVLWATHKWVGLLAAVIALNVAVTGFLLLVKKRFAWIQPPEQPGVARNVLSASFDEILGALRSVPEADVASWEDVDRLDVRPSKGMMKVQCRNGYEVQLDTSTGRPLQVMVRRSDFIESLHDGSFFGGPIHSFVMPAFAISLALLALTGVALWLEPKFRRRRRTSRASAEPGRGIDQAEVPGSA